MYNRLNPFLQRQSNKENSTSILNRPSVNPRSTKLGHDMMTKRISVDQPNKIKISLLKQDVKPVNHAKINLSGIEEPSF